MSQASDPPHKKQVVAKADKAAGQQTNPTVPVLPASLMVSAWWWLRAVCIVGTVLGVYQVLVILGGVVSALLTVVLYLFFGAVVSFLVRPGVDVLQARCRLHKTPAILLTLIGVVGILALLMYAATGPLINEANSLTAHIPRWADQLKNVSNNLTDQLHKRGIEVSTGNLSSNFAADIPTRAVDFFISSIKGTLQVLVNTLIILVVAFWLLKDGELLRANLAGILPGRVRSATNFGLDAIGVVFGGYVRAQLVMAFLIATLSGLGCAILGVPFPLVVAISAGIFELVPLVGPFIGGIIAMLLALTVSVGLCLATLLLFIGIHVIESYVLAPRIQARFIQLHPLVALLSLLAGVEVAGFLGALVAVPIASLLAVFIRAAVGDWQAQHPELFAVGREDRFRERRRRKLLGEFKLFRKGS